MRFAIASVVLPAALCAAFPSMARAEFSVPDGNNFPWTRSASAWSTYAQWDRFASAAGPNTPDVGAFVGGDLPPAAPAWNVFDATGMAIVTGSGNIYSPAGPANIHVIVPAFDLGATHATTILFQVRTVGAEIAPGTLNIAGFAPAETTELHRELGGGGFIVETLYRWEFAGNAGSYEVQFLGAGPHLSLDRVAIDTFAAPIPAPASVGLLSLAGLITLRRRR